MARRINYFTGLYVCSFAALGSLFPFIGQYLAHIGFSGASIGIITASATAIGILSNPFWGAIYHRRGNNKNLILFFCIFTAVLSLSLMAVTGYTQFLFLYIIVFFFENPIFPLIDSTTLEANYPFGAARKWGAVGYALGIGVTGGIADKIGLVSIFPVFASLLLLTSIMIKRFIHSRRDLPSWVSSQSQKQDTGAGSYRDLIYNKEYMALLASTFFINGPSFAHNTYFSFLYIDQGGTITGMGIALLLMAVSEAPFMAWSECISARFTLERMILIAMCVCALRFLWYSTGPTTPWLMGTFFLQGFINGIFLVETMKYIKKLVNPKLIPLAVSLYTALSSNCGTITCQFAGGIVVGSSGGKGVYLFYGLFNLIGIAIYLAFGLHHTKKLKK
ncbi:MAG: MFS transporter [Syntrophomonadaceae bacterium]|nr:MFS transporter [Syntrophomonadaceae bacterium]